MRRVATTLALALCLLGCGQAPVGVPVQLLTGVDACYAGGEQGVESVLLPDPEFGTRFDDRPVMWPLGFTAVQLLGGEVAVIDDDGKHLATTGKTYFISYAPVYATESRELMERFGAFPAAASCGHPWDFKEVK